MPGQPPPAQPGQQRPAVEQHAGGQRGPTVAARAADAAEAGPGTADIYLMSSERDTGQPAPPELPGSPSGNLRGERPARVAIGLSGA
jgi:hypothetical protein